MDVWIVTTLDGKGSFFVQGVFSTMEKALAACKTELDAAARFPLDADCREVTEFDIATLANPFPTCTAGDQG